MRLFEDFLLFNCQTPEDCGYRPFVTDDISKGRFVFAGEMTFDINFRHGTVIPVTDEEYDRLTRSYSDA